jgi:hypothetical protein
VINFATQQNFQSSMEIVRWLLKKWEEII